MQRLFRHKDFLNRQSGVMKEEEGRLLRDDHLARRVIEDYEQQHIMDEHLWRIVLSDLTDLDDATVFMASKVSTCCRTDSSASAGTNSAESWTACARSAAGR